MPNIMPGINAPPGMRHEYGHASGYADFIDENVVSIMNGKLGMFASQLTVNDELVGFLTYHLDVRPGNTFPDTNP